MYIRNLCVLILSAALSCTSVDESDHNRFPSGQKAEVTIGAYQLPDTRTTLDPDGRTTRWSVDDRIAVWAVNDAGFALDAQTFDLHTYKSEYSAANFSATIPHQMEEAVYTYYAVYPIPTRHEGTNVTFSIPSIQTGLYDGSADIMAAVPVAGPALTKNPHEELTLAFRHLCHALRIEIPAGRNRLGTPVKRLEVVFPAAVAGTLTFDAARPDLPPVLTDGTDTVVIDFPNEGLADTEGCYAWIFVAPTQIEGDITFRAYNTDGYQATAIRTTVSKQFEGGHTTPVTLTVPEARPITYLDFKVASNNLGEELTDIRLVAKAGIFVEPFQAADANEVSVAKNADGLFRAEVYADAFPASALGGLPLTVDYESENALLQGHALSLPAEIADGAAVNVSLHVPYLFEEDFSGVVSFNYYDDKGSASNASNPDAIELSDKALPGWTGSRIGASAGKALRVCCHYEGAGFAYGRYDGRIDSPPMSGIKEGRSVKVRVSYDYDGGTTQSGKDTSPAYDYGYTTNQDKLNGSTKIETQIASGIVLSKYNGYDNIGQTNTYEFDGCTLQHRLSWKISNNRSGWTSYFGDYFLYLDNIKVQIIR